MSQTCRCCRHERREELDRNLVNGVPHRTIADRYQVSTTSVSRHREHVRDLLEVDQVERMAQLTAMVEQLRERVLAMLDQAERTNDLRAGAALAREVRSCIEVLARFHVDHSVEERLRRLEVLAEEQSQTGWRRTA